MSAGMVFLPLVMGETNNTQQPPAQENSDNHELEFPMSGPAIFRLDSAGIASHTSSEPTITVLSGLAGEGDTKAVMAYPLIIEDGHLELGELATGQDYSQFIQHARLVAPQRKTAQQSPETILQGSYRPFTEGYQSLDLLATDFTHDPQEAQALIDRVNSLQPLEVISREIALHSIHWKDGFSPRAAEPSTVTVSMMKNGLIVVQTEANDHLIPATLYQAAILGNNA